MIVCDQEDFKINKKINGGLQKFTKCKAKTEGKCEVVKPDPDLLDR